MKQRVAPRQVRPLRQTLRAVMQGLDDIAHNRLLKGWPGKFKRIKGYGRRNRKAKCRCREIRRLTGL